jgi:hypothetical protein
MNLILMKKFVHKASLPGFIQRLDYWWHTACLLMHRCVSKARRRRRLKEKPQIVNPRCVLNPCI